jgi:hypothetical protein
MLHDPSGNPGFVLQQLQSMVANKPVGDVVPVSPAMVPSMARRQTITAIVEEEAGQEMDIR